MRIPEGGWEVVREEEEGPGLLDGDREVGMDLFWGRTTQSRAS